MPYGVRNSAHTELPSPIPPSSLISSQISRNVVKSLVSSALLASCIVMTGCAGSDLMVKRQAETEAKLEHLLQTGKRDEMRVNELSAKIQAMDDQAKASSLQMKQLQDTIQELRIAHEDFKARLALLARQAATPKVEVVNPEVAPKEKDAGPPPEYVKAFGLYSANNFAAAVTAFEAFLKDNPQSDYIPNALYWIGECHYSQSDLVKALAAFQKVVENYPRSAKAPDAMLKMGYTLAAMKEKDKANAAFENLIKTYPSSPSAAKARERLTAN